MASSRLIGRAVSAIQADPDLRYYLGMRCGFHPDMLAMSVAGYTVGHVSAQYRETLARYVHDQGVAAIDTSVSHLVREVDADGHDSVRVVEDAFEIRPMFHGVQVAARAIVATAAQATGLEERVLAEIAECVLATEPYADVDLAGLTGDAFDEQVRRSVRASERCTGVVSGLAIAFARSVADDGVRRADIASATLVELEWMLRLRVDDSARSPAQIQARPLPVNSVFHDGVAKVPVNHAVWALQNAIRDAILGVGWSSSAGGAALEHVTRTNKGRGRVTVSVRERQHGVSDPDKVSELWDKVRSLDDLTADALLVCLAHWAAAQTESMPPVWISADAVLDARGIQRIRRRGEPATWQHGHRREDRLAAGRALAQLDNLWLEIVDVEVVSSAGGRVPHRLRGESRAIAILDRVVERDADGHEVFLGARVVPGEWARSLWDSGLRQTGILARQALAYDPYRSRPERWLARYFALAFRWNARRRTPLLRLRVATLLTNAALVPDSARPQRCRDRLERALDRLRTDEVIGDWRYEIDPGELPARHWLGEWREMVVQIDPPEIVRRRYAGVNRRTT